MGYPDADEAQDQLRQAGWLVSDMALPSAEGVCWIVLGHLGNESLRAEGATREEAWRHAWEQVQITRPVPPSPPAPEPVSSPPKESPPAREPAAGKPAELFRFEGARYWVESVAVSPDGRLVVTGSGQPQQTDTGQGEPDFSVRVWDLETGRELHRFLGHTHWVMSVAFAPDGRRVLSGSYDSTLRLWDLESGGQFRCFKGHGDRVRSVAYGPDGRLALSGGYDKTVRLWDVETGREVRCFEGHGNWVTCVAFGPGGNRALSGSFDHTVRVWDLEGLGPGASGDSWVRSLRKLLPGGNRRELARLQGHTQNVTSVAFAPDSRRALSGSIDKTVRLWDLKAGKEERCFKGHTRGVMSVAFSPDGRSALSGGMDHRVFLWDVDTGRELFCYEGHTDLVTSVAFTPDGARALTGGADKTLRLWKLPAE